MLALSQLSRAVEQRGVKDRRPQLSDLRESGSIEQDADLVMFVYRDDYYDPESEHKGEAELIISKHRNGPLDSVQLAYQGRYTRFANMAQRRRLSEWTPMPCSVVVGAQWGDEGKGKIVDTAGRAGRRGRPLPGRQQRRPHAGAGRRDLQAAAGAQRHPLPGHDLRARATAA